MPSITVRLRRAVDEEIVRAAKIATHEVTATKALLRAAQLYPDTARKLEAAHLRIDALHRDLERLTSAVLDWQKARGLEQTAAARLEEILTRTRS